MPDHIETLTQLVEHAELREIVIHELMANRESPDQDHETGLPPEELHAPGSSDEIADMRFTTHLTDDELSVRCRMMACNAYGVFGVDGEVTFSLTAPVSPSATDIVQEFAERIGAFAAYPYLRAAIASLAAQLAVAATPLPLLRAGDISLTTDEEVIDTDQGMHPIDFTVSTTADDGAEPIEGFLDPATGTVVRIGGEEQTPELDQLLDSWATIPPAGELTWDWMVRQHGEDGVRGGVEELRSTNGDAATDAMLTQIDQAVARIAAEALNAAVQSLDSEVTSAASIVNGSDIADHDRPLDRDVLLTLLSAAERVIDRWNDVMSSAGISGET